MLELEFVIRWCLAECIPVFDIFCHERGERSGLFMKQLDDLADESICLSCFVIEDVDLINCFIAAPLQIQECFSIDDGEILDNGLSVCSFSTKLRAVAKDKER